MSDLNNLADLATFLAFARLDKQMYGGVAAEDAWTAFVHTQRSFDPVAGEILFKQLTQTE
jgi:hypothetical protein